MTRAGNWRNSKLFKFRKMLRLSFCPGNPITPPSFSFSPLLPMHGDTAQLVLMWKNGPRLLLLLLSLLRFLAHFFKKKRGKGTGD